MRVGGGKGDDGDGGWMQKMTEPQPSPSMVKDANTTILRGKEKDPLPLGGGEEGGRHQEEGGGCKIRGGWPLNCNIFVIHYVQNTTSFQSDVQNTTSYRLPQTVE
jgi:hypothetical protein